MQKVLFCVDGSSHSLKAIQYARANHVIQPKDHILVVNVRPQVMINHHFGLKPLGEEQVWPNHQEDVDRMHKILVEQQQVLKKQVLSLFDGDDHPEWVALVGEAKYELEKYIQQVQPDLVVMAHRGLGSLDRLLLGSVSEYLIHHVTCPVLISK